MKFPLINAPNLSLNITEPDLEHFYIRNNSSQISKQSNTAAERTQLLYKKNLFSDLFQDRPASYVGHKLGMQTLFFQVFSERLWGEGFRMTSSFRACTQNNREQDKEEVTALARLASKKESIKINAKISLKAFFFFLEESPTSFQGRKHYL